ncbi:MAG: trimeric intracellular cation channel family protein [Clostridiales bacterium]|nr:trimeric intracellular cation channel family protein [Clostridiales bacterium]
MELFLFIFEIIGTISFAVSGALTGIRRNMDIFGVCILGMTTAVGGGMIRDIILGSTPPAAFENPVYVLIAVAVSIITFVIYVLRRGHKSTFEGKIFDFVMLVTDSAGLGVFTVYGVKTALDSGAAANHFLVIFVAVLTGVGGGVMRDIFAGDRPYIFVKHIYACASLAGALVCLLCWNTLGQSVSMEIGFVIVVVLRLLAAKFRWSLPRPNADTK